MDGEAGACAPSWSHAWRAVAWNDRFCSRSRTSDAARSRDQGGDGKTDGGTHLAVVVARPHRGEQQRHGGAARRGARVDRPRGLSRSEEHTSELPSLLRNSYAVFCLKKKNKSDINSLMSISYAVY